ncbi:MAG: VOC family protein [Betaproteobacteria bacterium]|nr:VOC family protein [Betaproteobacteria bacterium]
MKRIHIGLAVQHLEESARFYSDLFGAEPVVQRADYAKWMLEDPRVNFSITSKARDASTGEVHFGIQVESENELQEISSRLRAAGRRLIAEGETSCCYHKSTKAWVMDPNALPWETFFTHGEATVYGENTPEVEAARREARCCD